MISFTREQVVNAARTYLGVKFRMYGRDRTGLDCVGLLYCVASDLGFSPENFTDYTTAPESVKLQKMLDKYTYAVGHNPPRTGQVLKLRQYIFPMHVGILVVDGARLSVINANMSRKKVVEDTFQDWEKLVMEHRELKGIEG